MEVSECWNIVEFSNISIKMKNVEAQTAIHLREIIPPPTR